MMSEERFELVEQENNWVVDDSTRKKFYLTKNEVVDLLNEQDKEIKRLQYICDAYKNTRWVFLYSFLMFMRGIEGDSDEELSDEDKKLVTIFLEMINNE